GSPYPFSIQVSPPLPPPQLFIFQHCHSTNHMKTGRKRKIRQLGISYSFSAVIGMRNSICCCCLIARNRVRVGFNCLVVIIVVVIVVVVVVSVITITAVTDATIIQLIFSAIIIQAEVPTKNSSYQLMLIHPSNFELFLLIPEFSWPNQLFHSVPVSIITPTIHV
ncbi:MAG: hypothetical protein EZS28_056365, partial [Streblomastix strix]